MARKSLTYTVQKEGRDFGKTFLITEMSASQAERWAMRAILALISGGAQMPEGYERLGMAAMAEQGLRGLMGLRWEVVEPLMAEMFECLQFMPDPAKPHVLRKLIEQDIEEIATRIELRAEIWKLHTDFLNTAAPSILATARPAAAASSPNTPTSPPQ